MLSRMQLKRAVKFGAGSAAVVASRFTQTEQDVGCILTYHRVADVGLSDPSNDDWNVTPRNFERQVRGLLDFAEIVPLTELYARCRKGGERKPLVALTFDDGYANFHSQVLPILKRYGVPATLFVVTGLIGRSSPPPFDTWSMKNWSAVAPEAWRSLGWSELEECVHSGLVELGGHSHLHLKATECSPAMLVEEAGRSRDILSARFGDILPFAYPYGCTRLGYVPAAYVEAVEAAGYDLAVTYDLGRVTARTDRYRVPRLEAHGLDGPAIMRAKVHGSLLPYRFTDRLRRPQ